DMAEDSDQGAQRRGRLVWGFVPLTAAMAALSAFADPAVRTAEYKYGQMNTYGLDVRVWGIKLQRERVFGTPASLHAMAETRELQWRWGLAIASAFAAGGTVAAVFARLRPGLPVKYR